MGRDPGSLVTPAQEGEVLCRGPGRCMGADRTKGRLAYLACFSFSDGSFRVFPPLQWKRRDAALVVPPRWNYGFAMERQPGCH